MPWYLLFAGLFLCLSPSPSTAASLTVAEQLILNIDPLSGWTVHLADPPEELVRELARHVAHEPAAARATPEQVQMVARARLMANQAIVYHASSGAHLDVDFSPFDEGAGPPGPGALKNSAEHAARSLANEKDVTDAAWDVRPADIDGAGEVYLLSAKYRQHGRSMIFRGYVGTVERHWFFLYFTAPGDNPQVLAEMESMLAGASIRIVEQ